MQTLDEVFKMAVENGCRAFKVNRGEMSGPERYGFIITPKQSILYIQDHSILTPFKMFHMSYQYKPCREYGTGCEAIDECSEITMDKIKEAEECGLAYVAKSAGKKKPAIRKWESFNEWYEHYWDAKNLEEVFV